MAFHIGQKVVCIKSGIWANSAIEGGGPQKGDIGTISGIDQVTFGEYIFMREWGEWGWKSDKFRPIVSSNTDISIFRELLHDPTRKIEETV